MYRSRLVARLIPAIGLVGVPLILASATGTIFGAWDHSRLGLKGVFLVTTLIGVTGLWPAILADTGATVLVTLNAMRLLGWRGR